MAIKTICTCNTLLDHKLQEEEDRFFDRHIVINWDKHVRKQYKYKCSGEKEKKCITRKVTVQKSRVGKTKNVNSLNIPNRQL